MNYMNSNVDKMYLKNGNQTIILRFIFNALTFIRYDDTRKMLKIPTVEEIT